MLLLLGALALIPPSPPLQVLRRLSAPQVVTHPGNVVNAALAPDGNHAVYVEEFSGSLYSVPSDGGTPVRLSSFQTSREVVPLFRFTPSGQQVLYRARSLPNGSSLDEDPTLDLFSAPIDGSVPPELLGGPAEGDFQTTPDGAYVLFRGRIYPSAAYDLVANKLDGTFGRVIFNGLDVGVSGFRAHPDSRQVVLRAEKLGLSQLFRTVIADRPPPPVVLSGAPTSVGPVQPDFELLPDGSQVLYRADEGLNGTLDLLAVPVLVAGAPRRLSSGSLTGDVRAFHLAPNGVRVLYLGALETAGARELFSVPLDQSSAPVRLNAALSAGGAVLETRIDRASRRVVYRVALAEEVVALDSAPLDGSAPATRLFGPLRGRGSLPDDFRITANGRTVVFRADADGDRLHELYAVRATGGAPVRLTAPDAAVSEFALFSGGVLFRAELDTPGVPELFGARLDGTQPPVRIHPPLAFGHAVGRFSVAPDGRRALCLADPTVRGVSELFRVRADAAPQLLRLSPDSLRQEAGPAPVQDFFVAGSRALYRGSQEAEDVLGLYSVPLDGSGAPVALHPPQPSAGGVRTHALTPGGARVVFVTGGEHRGSELHSAPADGRAPTLRLDAPVQPRSDVESRFQLTPDGAQALFVSDAELDETFELFRVPVAGGASPLRLHPPLRAGRAVEPSFQVSADGTQVAFVSDLAIARRFELYSVPLDASRAPRRLSQKASGGGDVRQVELVGSVAVYLADQDRDEQFELFRVPLDGSSAPLRLSDALVPGGDVGTYALDPSGTWVVYLADQELDEKPELYAVPLDARAPARKLNHSLRDEGGVGSFRITPDGTRVVFLATELALYGAYIAPIDGSAPAIHVSLGHAGFLPTWDYHITPDSTRLVFRVETGSLRIRPGLFSAQLDGSQWPVPLHVPSVLAPAFQLAPDDASVLYASHPANDFQYSIYRVPREGPRESSLELVPGIRGAVTQLEEHAGTVVFLANGELFAW